jgi:hypothetical protein
MGAYFDMLKVDMDGDRIITAHGMPVTVRRAIEMNIYTTRSLRLKRDETAGYIQLVRATGEAREGDPDTFV